MNYVTSKHGVVFFVPPPRSDRRRTHLFLSSGYNRFSIPPPRSPSPPARGHHGRPEPARKLHRSVLWPAGQLLPHSRDRRCLPRRLRDRSPHSAPAGQRRASAAACREGIQCVGATAEGTEGPRGFAPVETGQGQLEAEQRGAGRRRQAGGSGEGAAGIPRELGIWLVGTHFPISMP